MQHRTTGVHRLGIQEHRPGLGELSEKELEVETRRLKELRARNKEALKQLVTAPLDLTFPAAVRAPRAPRTFSVRVPVEPRRSARSDGKVVSYTFDDEAGERRPRTAGAPRRRRSRSPTALIGCYTD
jgi:hypothetical protein